MRVAVGSRTEIRSLITASRGDNGPRQSSHGVMNTHVRDVKMSTWHSAYGKSRARLRRAPVHRARWLAYYVRPPRRIRVMHPEEKKCGASRVRNESCSPYPGHLLSLFVLYPPPATDAAAACVRLSAFLTLSARIFSPPRRREKAFNFELREA